MKKLYAVVVSIIISGISAVSFAQAGRDVMEKYSDHFKVTDESTKATMTLINKEGKQQNRSLNILTKRYPNDMHKTLITFTSPEKISGTGLLIVENQGRGDDQWLYLPVLKKVKKISTAERSHSFMGSEFAYEDLRGEVLKDFSYQLIGSEAVNGQDCFKIEATPVRAGETGYGKRILWIRKDIFFKTKVEYYDKGGKILKTEADEDMVQIGGGKYRMNTVVMQSSQSGNKTLLKSNSRDINSGVPDSKFTTSYLEQGA